MAADAHLIIEAVAADGKPTEPKANASKFVHQCGVVVRDNVPISIQEWNEPKKLEGDMKPDWVSVRTKDVLWAKLIAKFTLPGFKPWRIKILMMEFLCGTQISHALAYVLSHGESRS